MIPFTKWHSGKANIVTRNGLAVTKVCGWGGDDYNGEWGTIWGGIISVLCLDFGGGYMAICMYINLKSKFYYMQIIA